MGKNNLSHVLWIAWEKHRRTIELCQYFNIPSLLLDYNLPRILKHPLLIFETIFFIATKRPKVLIVQNPSIILTTLACIMHYFFRFRLIVDAHNGGLFPDNLILKKLKFLYAYYIKTADLVVVTNKYLADFISKKGGKPYILPDKIPNLIQGTEKKNLKGEYNILSISTFGDDEPFREIFKLAAMLPKNVYIYMTGNTNKLSPESIRQKPQQLILTDFLPTEEYWVYLNSVDLVMDLTTREDCLVCGAYEAVAVCTPLVLSDTRALKKYFYKGALFSKNNATPLLRGTLKAIKNMSILKQEVTELKSELNLKWDNNADNFMNKLLPSRKKVRSLNSPRS